MFWTVPLSIIRNFFTVHSAMVYVCDELITLPEESYRLWCIVHDLATSRMRRPAFEQDQVLLKSCLQTFITYTIAECTVKKLLMMDRGTVRNMQSFMPE